MEMLSVVLTDKNKVSGCRDDDYCRLSTLVLKSVVCTGRGSDGKCICVVEGLTSQLFSKRDSRSSLLLLGRSGGSRYDRTSSEFIRSGSRFKEVSRMSALL